MEQVDVVVIDETAVTAAVKKSWKLLMALGVVFSITGVVCMLAPTASGFVIGSFIGWLLVIGGALQLLDALLAREPGRTALRVIGAAITLGVGIWILSSDYKGTFALATLLAIWFFVVGLFRVIAGLRERGTPGAGLVLFNGILSLILGVLIIGHLPSSAPWAIGLLVGIDFFFAGLALIVTAQAAKKL